MSTNDPANDNCKRNPKGNNKGKPKVVNSGENNDSTPGKKKREDNRKNESYDRKSNPNRNQSQKSEAKKKDNRRHATNTPKNENLPGNSPAINPVLIEFCKSIKKHVEKWEKQTEKIPIPVAQRDSTSWKNSFDLASSEATAYFFGEFQECLLKAYCIIAETESFAPPAVHIVKLLTLFLQRNSSQSALDLVVEVIQCRLGRSISVKTVTSEHDKQRVLEEFRELASIMMKKSDAENFGSVMSIGHEYIASLKSYNPVAKNRASQVEGSSEAWNTCPTIGWLMDLSKMQVNELRDEYDSIEAYTQTMSSLWTYMTFYWGIGALWPKCSHTAGTSTGPADAGQRCGNPLLTCTATSRPCTMRIRSQGGAVHHCGNPSQWTCFRRGHDAICETCLQSKHQGHLGPTGQYDASTDIYDAEVAKISSKAESTTLVFKKVKSRKPPAVDVNWRTSYRLQSAGLVGIISVSSSVATLQRDMRIYLGEIVKHDNKSDDEFLRRKNGLLDVRLLCRTDAAILDVGYEIPFFESANVAIIDMRVFVPEVISVLATLCDPSFVNGLKRIPFREALCGRVVPRPIFTTPWDNELESLLLDAVVKSDIRAFRNLSQEVKESFVEDLSNMPVIQSLDRTQKMAFVYGLTCDIHITQGPPGTGKSYVGVCLVLAFVLLRKKLLQQGISVGPILSLSYKNHALDEFLLDCQKHNPSLKKVKKLIRLGRPDDGALLAFTEKNSALESEAQKELDRRIGAMKDLKGAINSWTSALGMEGTITGAILAQAMKVIVLSSTDSSEKIFNELSKFSKWEVDVSDFFCELVESSAHWKGVSDDAVIILTKWINGEIPPPRCQFRNNQRGEEVICKHYAVDSFAFCETHKCKAEVCEESRTSARKPFCTKHSCGHVGCTAQSLLDVQLCADHVCIVCAAEPRLSVEHNGCELHSCRKIDCKKASLSPLPFCIDHTCEICLNIDQISESSECCQVGGDQLMSKFCISHKCQDADCSQPRYTDKSQYCTNHSCGICDNHVDGDSLYCSEHRCSFIVDYDTDKGCAKYRIRLADGRVSLFCEHHTCVGCAADLGGDVDAMVVAPRFTCSEHKLCDTYLEEEGRFCPCLAANNSNYCTFHTNKVVESAITCCGRKKDTKACKAPRPKDAPEGPWFCNAHIDQMVQFASDIDFDDAPSLGYFSPILALQNRNPMPVRLAFKSNDIGRFAAATQYQKLMECSSCKKYATSHTISIENGVKLCIFDQRKCRKELPLKDRAVVKENNNLTISQNPHHPGPISSTWVQLKERAEVAAASTVLQQREFVHDDDGNVVDAAADNLANADEMDSNYVHTRAGSDSEDDEDDIQINDALEHNRQLFQEEEEDDDNSQGEQTAGLQDNPLLAEYGLQILSGEDLRNLIGEWTWDLPLQERVRQSRICVFSCIKILSTEMAKAERYVDDARQEKSEATAAALKQATLIGGTVVGVAKRLAALRAAEPFAIIVEEACEVMEPTLIAVLAVESLQKLELVGDHMQLPAFVSNCWFNIESTMPSIKTSLFERLVNRGGNTNRQRGRALVAAAAAAAVEDEPAGLHTILDVQRRMRSSISDLTRGEYDHIIPIIDHPHTSTQRIGDRVQGDIPNWEKFRKLREMWVTPRLPPGLQSPIFFWNMVNNTQSRPKVGLSACNENEALAVAQLVEYFLMCGVPAPCITVITPYQGQKREIIKIMRSKHLLPKFFRDKSPKQQQEDDANSVIISTVDRYQGDENDIVILSLVRCQPGNRFVSFANRFIVAASRARLGFYIIGSVEAVVPRDNSGPRHWKRFVEKLEIASEDGLVKVGDALPLCCPCHPDSRRSLSSDHRNQARNFPTKDSWLCTENCTTPLFCQHPCDLPCHYPTADKHQSRCPRRLRRPCSELGHEKIPLLCGDVSVKGFETFSDAYRNYRCDIVSKYMRSDCNLHEVELPCSQYQDYERSSWPACEGKVPAFIHPTCGHRFENINCHTYRQYEKNPPVCEEQIKIKMPSCSHEVTVKCYKQETYRRGCFDCVKIVDKARPRCSHIMQTRCHIAQTIDRCSSEIWGYEIENLDGQLVLEESRDYGPAENTVIENFPAECVDEIAVKRSCGHILTKIKCNQAFRFIEDPSLMSMCEVSTPTACPFCQKKVQTTCSKVSKLSTTLFRNILTVNNINGRDILFIEENKMLGFRNALSNTRNSEFFNLLRAVKCQTVIGIRRECNPTHVDEVPCHRLISILFGREELKRCIRKVDKLQPVCKHTVSVPCDVVQLPICEEDINREYCDPRCGCISTIRRCGDWYALQQDPNIRTCDKVVSTHFERCGHSIDILCDKRKSVERVSQPGIHQVATTDTGEVLVYEVGEYCLPCEDAPLCRVPVSFQRDYCDHIKTDIPCFEAFNWTKTNNIQNRLHPPQCTELVLLDSHPVCGIHEATWTCWIDKELCEWDPWKKISDLGLPTPSLSPDGVLVFEEGTVGYLQHLKLDLPASIRQSDIACQNNLLVKMPGCQHIRSYTCRDFFAQGQQDKLRCEESVTHKCNKCYNDRHVTCWEDRYIPPAQLDSKCTFQVTKVCIHCQTNFKTVSCCEDRVECRTQVEKVLPCGHVATWTCSPNYTDIVSGHDVSTNFNRLCVECCISAWDTLSKVQFSEEQIRDIVRRRLESALQPNGTSDVSLGHSEDLRILSLERFHRDIQEHIRRIVKAMQMKAVLPTPPPVRPKSSRPIVLSTIKPSAARLSASANEVEDDDEEEDKWIDESVWAEYLVNSFLDVVFIANAPNKAADPANVDNRFSVKETKFGLSVPVHSLHRENVIRTLLELPHTSDAKTDFWIALVYRGLVQINPAPNANPKQSTNSDNKARQVQRDKGYCGVIHALDAQLNNGEYEEEKLWQALSSPQYEHFVWSKNSIIPTTIVKIALQAQCCLQACSDKTQFTRDHKYGIWCSSNHFVCWECFEMYAENACRLDSNTKPTKDRHLPCCGPNNCPHSYELRQLGEAKAPESAFGVLNRFERDIEVREAAEKVRQEEQHRFEVKLQRELELSEVERRINTVVNDIRENILCNRCPGCKNVWDTFDACFKVTCACGMPFCAWCLAANADHGHVATCPLNPRQGYVYGDHNVLRMVHNHQRVEKIRQRLQAEPNPNIVQQVLQKLRVDFNDLGLIYE